MYLFVYVPVAGRIASASARNQIGTLSMRSKLIFLFFSGDSELDGVEFNVKFIWVRLM
jgi:hypothetical protein